MVIKTHDEAPGDCAEVGLFPPRRRLLHTLFTKNPYDDALPRKRGRSFVRINGRFPLICVEPGRALQGE